MTEPSNQTPSKSAILRMDALIEAQGQWEKSTATRRAFALHLDEVDRVAREALEAMGRVGCYAELDFTKHALRSLMLPDPVDPDEELAKEIATSFGDKWSWYDLTLADIIKRLREMGKLVKETPDD